MENSTILWTIIAYVVVALFNIKVVAKVRTTAAEKGRSFLASGRFAWIAVFLLCFLQLLIKGSFEAFNDPNAFVDLLQSASAATVAIVGAHSGLKTGQEAIAKLNGEAEGH